MIFFILSTMGLIAYIRNTLMLARHRYWKRYQAVFVEKKPPFTRWWLKKYAVHLSIAVGCYILVAAGLGYVGYQRLTTAKANRYTAQIENKPDQHKLLWKRYVELSAAAENEPENVAMHLQLARTLRDLRMGQKAVAAYQKVLYLDAKSLDASYELGRLAVAMGDTTLAKSQVTEIAGKWPNRPESYLIQAQMYLREGKSDEAREQWRIALAKDPGNKEARTLLIAACLKQRAFGDAVRLAEVGVKLAPADSDLHILLARSLIGMGRIAEAQAVLRTAAERDFASPAPVLMLADLQVQQGDYLAAIKSYEEVLNRNPDHMPAMNNIAMLTADHGYELDRAVVLASRMYARFPKDPAVADTLGWVLFKQGKLDQALPLLRFAASGAPRNPVHRYHLGAALLKDGKTESGRNELEAALKISGTFDGAAQARALLAGKG
jgi:tetratricopeptide (TPR) repeat protein